MLTENLLDFPTTTETRSSSWLHISEGGVDKKISVADFISSVNGGNPFNITVREESGNNIILTLADKNAYIRCLNSVQTTVQVKNAATVGWQIGDSIIFRKEGLGNVLFAPDSGVTLRGAASGLSLTEVGQAGQLICVDNTPTATVFDFVTGGNARATVTGSITFLTVAALGTGATNDGYTVDPAQLAANNTLVRTIWNNTTSKAGGDKYVIWTLAAYRTHIGNPSWVPDGYGDHYFVNTSHVAILHGNKKRATSFGLIDGVSHDNTAAFAALTRAIKDGDDIDFEGGEYRIFSAVPGINSSGATPATTRAISSELLPIVENKAGFTLRDGVVYAADQQASGSKKYYPCTLSLIGCSNAKLINFSAESKGESFGDADASVSLSTSQRIDFLPYNSGVALLVGRCKNIEIKGGSYRFCGSVGAIYISSSSGIKINGVFANPASLGYASFAIDAWLGDTASTGFRIHDTHVKSCTTHRETLLRREDSAPTGSTIYSSKGCVVAEDASIKVTVSGGYYADAYPNGSARDIGNAFSANACTVIASGAVVENCASVGMTGQSANVVGRLICSDIEARNIRKTMHQIQATSFATQEFKYTNCDVEINNSGVWPGDGNRAREFSSVVANMKVTTPVHGIISNCRITGSQCIWVNDNASYGNLMIDNCDIVTDGYLCLSNGWGGASRDFRRGVKIKDSSITDISAIATPYAVYTNYDGAAFTFINLDFSTSELDSAVVREAYSITIAGSGLVTRINGFDKIRAAWSSNPYLKSGIYPISYKEQRGLSGPNRRVVFEYPNRVAFQPFSVNDNTTTGKNDVFRVLSAVGAAVVNADGNVEQEFFINDTDLTLWAADTLIPGVFSETPPPLL